MEPEMPDSRDGCVFCVRISEGSSRPESEAAVAFPDAHPVSEGHTLVVPRRHVTDVFDLDTSEYRSLWELVHEVRWRLDEASAPAGYNVGVNVGAAGGQTVDHAHVHVIPRYEGDVADPRGGIRQVLPERARYWAD